MSERARQRAVKEAHLKAVEKALREERLAIAAIVKVMLIEVPDPRRVLARLDAMSRAAEANPRTPATVRKQLIDATLFVKTAIERETQRPQTLFEPNVGHTRPEEVDALVKPTEGPQQLGLVNHGSTLGDVEQAHEERVRTLARMHDAIVSLLREHGAMTDRDLWTRYTLLDENLPPQTKGAITERRRELYAAGRVVSAGRGARNEPAWNLVEAVAA